MKKVIVTGSSRGIGKAIAEALSLAGYEVATHSRSPGTDLVFDVSDREKARAELEKWVEANGAPYGIVLNAGIAADSIFPAMEGCDWDRVVKTDLESFYNILKPLVMPMISERVKGRIVAIVSVSGISGRAGQTNYAAAKAGLEAAAKSLALELAPRGITVNCVAPGIIETDMTEGVYTEAQIKAIPAMRMGSPSEVAAAVKFLMSEEASYITRQTLRVDGGMI